ncbi:MAG: mannosyltransferase family protein [Solirubrobacteraceae bacterium]
MASRGGTLGAPGAPLALGAEAAAGLRAAWRAAWRSRLVVVAAAVAGLALLGHAPGWADYDPARLTQPFGGAADLLVAPFARWDSVWFLDIASGGYAPEAARAAFFPLYPALAAIAGAPAGSPLIGGLLVSWGALLAGLAAVHRLAARDLGERYAAPALMVLAWFPSSLFLSAAYSESLFLALSAGTFLAARRGAWACAGVLGALAAATRSTGVLLVVPLLLIALYGPREDRPDVAAPPRRGRRARHAPGPELAWIALVPVGLGTYLGYLALAGLDPLEPFRAQAAWMRELSVPLAGVGQGLHAGWEGVLRLAGGGPLDWRAGGGDPLQDAALNVLLAGFLLGALALMGCVVRRLPPAYGAWAALSLAVPLSAPVATQPLMSLPRFLAVCFPLQMALAAWALDRGVLRPLLALSGAGLAGLSVVWGTWTFIA